MARIRRFEDLICCQKARLLANAIYDYTARNSFAGDFKLKGQIQGAAGSVMHNVAEGSDSGTDAEFIRFLKMARRSASEVQSELYLAMDRKYIEAADLKRAYELAEEAKRLINGLILYLRKNGPAKTAKVSEEPAKYFADFNTELPKEYYQPANADNFLADVRVPR